MPRPRFLLKWLVWVLVAALVVWFAIARRITDTTLAGAAYHSASLQALKTALESPSGEVGELRAGSARVEIAPPVDWEVPLAGNRQLRFTKAEGKHPESVWARALAVEQGGAAFLLISADIMVIYPELGEAVLERVRQEVDIERHQLMLVAAHTHSGPGGYWKGTLPEWSVGPFQQRVLDFLVDRLASAGIEAWRSLEPVEVSRDTVAVELPIQNRASEGGTENAMLSILRFESIGGDTVIDLANYSAHPTNLIKGNRLFTGDYPGLVAHRAEQADPHHTVIFTPGTIGDQKPWYMKERNRRLKAESIAEILYSQGLDRLSPVSLDSPVLDTFEFEVRMPPLQPRLLRSDWWGSWAVRDWIARPLFPATFDRGVVQVMRLGRTVLISAPADLGTSLAQPLFDRARGLGLEVVFVSMSEEWIGYLLTREEYEGFDYKVTSQFHGPLSGPLFADVYTRLIDALAERADADPQVDTAPAVESSDA